MPLNEEQRAIGRRMSEVSRRIDAAQAAYRATKASAGWRPIAHLIAATEHANVIGALCHQHNKLFCELLDAL
jgi:hypothetical protein